MATDVIQEAVNADQQRQEYTADRSEVLERFESYLSFARLEERRGYLFEKELQKKYEHWQHVQENWEQLQDIEDQKIPDTYFTIDPESGEKQPIDFGQEQQPGEHDKAQGQQPDQEHRQKEKEQPQQKQPSDQAQQEGDQEQDVEPQPGQKPEGQQKEQQGQAGQENGPAQPQTPDQEQQPGQQRQKKPSDRQSKDPAEEQPQEQQQQETGEPEEGSKEQEDLPQEEEKSDEDMPEEESDDAVIDEPKVPDDAEEDGNGGKKKGGKNGGLFGSIKDTISTWKDKLHSYREEREQKKDLYQYFLLQKKPPDKRNKRDRVLLQRLEKELTGGGGRTYAGDGGSVQQAVYWDDVEDILAEKDDRLAAAIGDNLIPRYVEQDGEFGAPTDEKQEYIKNLSSKHNEDDVAAMSDAYLDRELFTVILDQYADELSDAEQDQIVEYADAQRQQYANEADMYPDQSAGYA